MKGASGNVNAIDNADAITNLMQKTTTELEATGREYILAQVDGVVVFAPAKAGTKIAAGKGYITVPDAPAKLRMIFEGEPSAIESVMAGEGIAPAKRLVNGQIVIEKNGMKYNAAGALMK